METVFRKWYAVYTRSRAEFAVAGDFAQRGLEAYLPTVGLMRQWKDRRKRVFFPVFPSYLFVRLVPGYEQFAAVVNTRGVVTLLGPQPKSPVAIPDAEMENLMRYVESGEDLTVVSSLKTGTPVRITEGPLQGIQGVVEQTDAPVNGGHKVYIRIQLLGRYVGLRISPGSLEAA